MVRSEKEFLKTIIDSSEPGCLRIGYRYRRRESEIRMEEGIHVGRMGYATDKENRFSTVSRKVRGLYGSKGF